MSSKQSGEWSQIVNVESVQARILDEISLIRKEAKKDNQEVWKAINTQTISLEKLKSLLTGIKLMLALALSSGALLYVGKVLTS